MVLEEDPTARLAYIGINKYQVESDLGNFPISMAGMARATQERGKILVDVLDNEAELQEKNKDHMTTINHLARELKETRTLVEQARATVRGFH